MKRVLKVIAGLVLSGLVGHNPAIAGKMTLLGVGGGGGAVVTNPPTVLPIPGTYFNQNQVVGFTTNGLKPNAGLGGAYWVPSDATGSFAIYFEGTVDPALSYGTGWEVPFPGFAVSNNMDPGQPTFVYQKNYSSVPWFLGTGNPLNASASGGGGGNFAYNTGFYPFTGVGGNCLRQPTGIWEGATSVIQVVDPGFGCSTASTMSIPSIPGSGAQQSAGLAASLPAATCATGPVSGQITITTQVPVAHGITPGMTYNLGGFASPFATTYTALSGTTGTTLIGTAAINSGTCSGFADNSAGTALSGTGASTISFPAIGPTVPWNTGQTGITTKNGQHFCAIIGEYGDDSPFPGAQYIHMVDERGNALAGAPSFVPYPNQGTSNFTGYVQNVAQSSSATASLQVTALNSYTISSGSYNSTTGYMTFVTTTAPGFVPGSEFTVSGMNSTGGSVNVTYVAVNPTAMTAAAYQTSTTIYGNPLTGPGGTLQPITNPGTITTGTTPKLVPNIYPGMSIAGAYGLIAPYGTYGSTGTGGIGSYGLTASQGTFTITVTSVSAPSGGLSTMVATVSTLSVGQGFTLPGYTTTGPMVITAVGTGGSYTVSNPNTGSSAGGTATSTGTVGSSSTPVNIFAYTAFYYPTATPSGANPSGGSVTVNTRSNIGDFISIIGAPAATAPQPQKTGWGGSLGNFAMLYGIMPQASGGAPSTTSLASLCTKKTSIPTFVAANGMTINSLYRLNDFGIFGDSSVADFSGSISGTTLTITSPSAGLALPTNAFISGVGITGCSTACPKVSTGSGTPLTTYTLNVSGGTVAAEPLKAGFSQPSVPLQANTFSGYIDNAGSVPTLHILSLPTTPSFAAGTFTGSLETYFTASIASGTNQLVVTANPSGTVALGVGMTVTIPGGTPATAHISSIGTALGGSGTYTLDTTVTGASSSESMYGSGLLPGPATALVLGTTSGSFGPGSYVTDGGVSLTGQPILITGSYGSCGGACFGVPGNYYPSISNDTTMIASLSTAIPGEYIQNSGITVPVKILNYQGPCGIAGAQVYNNGSIGCYTLSASPNSTGTVGSSASPVTFVGYTATDGGAIAQGTALTIDDQGPQAIYPITPSTISCLGYGSCTATGSIYLTGTYDSSAFGTPSAIQAQFSLTAGGPPISGCSACAWTNLSNFTFTLSSGTIYNWSGTALNIPANSAPLFVSIREANATSYVTMRSQIKLGLPFAGHGQGQFGAFASAQSGYNWGFFTGLWGSVNRKTAFPGQVEVFLTGPPILGGYVPGQTLSNAGDRFGVTGAANPLSEAEGVFETLLTNAFGWPASFSDATHDGIGQELMTLGNQPQKQTIGLGNGTITSWCSQAKFCANVGQGGILNFNAAALTGAIFTGTISGTTLTVGTGSPTWTSGALMPGMVLSGTGITGSPTLVNCTANCGNAIAITGPGSTWTITNPGSVSLTAVPMRADYPQTGGTPWPTFNFQTGGVLPFNFGGFGVVLIQPGTFSVSVAGAVVCRDTGAFAYNNTGGACTGSGVSGWVNYQTGDYLVSFTTAPSGAVIASWVDNITPEALNSAQFSRPQNIDYFGTGDSQSGSISSLMARTPGGLAGFINAGCSTDEGYILQGASPTNQGYQYGAVGYSQATSWLYGKKFASVFPGFSAAMPQIVALQFRNEGAIFFNSNNNGGKLNICDQWGQDFSTQSVFAGHINANQLTLDSAATGPLWEGEVIACQTVNSNCPVASNAGIYITGLVSGAWGQIGSSYNLAGASGISFGVAGQYMQNAVYYQGSGPVIYGGTLNDIIVQNQGLAGTTGNNPHMSNGATGGRRVAARLAATIWEGFNGNTNVPPSLDRVKADAVGCDPAAAAAPCFDIGSTYLATASATWTGNTVTVTGGLVPHSRPFVVGQAFSCSSCSTGLVITSISVPPTQSIVTGAGEVSQTFTFTANNASGQTIGGTGSGTVAASCSGTSGVSSNCIDFAFSINVPGSFGVAAALATCGANNINGNTPNYGTPFGKCQDNGIGEITRGFRIGTTPSMYNPGATGSVFDDGADFLGGAFNRNGAFTCNIVAAKVVQCVIGAAYSTSTGLLTGVGKWTLGSTYANYGDMSLITGRIASVIGYVGGQSFPIANGGSGYTNGFYTSIPASCTTLASGGYNPKFDLTVVGGAIVSAVPSSISGGAGAQPMGLGIGGASGNVCTITSFPGMGSGTGGSINIPLAPNEGVGGVMTYSSDANQMGMFLYDNSGFSGNPLYPFFVNQQGGGLFEPGLPVRPFGQFVGTQISDSGGSAGTACSGALALGLCLNTGAVL